MLKLAFYRSSTTSELFSMSTLRGFTYFLNLKTHFPPHLQIPDLRWIITLLCTLIGSDASATHQAVLHHKACLRMNTRAGIRAVREFRAGPGGARGQAAQPPRKARTPRPALQARCCWLLLEDLPSDPLTEQKGGRPEGTKEPKSKPTAAAATDAEEPRRNG